MHPHRDGEPGASPYLGIGDLHDVGQRDRIADVHHLVPQQAEFPGEMMTADPKGTRTTGMAQKSDPQRSTVHFSAGRSSTWSSVTPAGALDPRQGFVGAN